MSDTKWRPVSELESFTSERFDFVWNDDYTMFQAVPLKWYDDASYARYQSGADNDDALYQMEDATFDAKGAQQ